MMPTYLQKPCQGLLDKISQLLAPFSRQILDNVAKSGMKDKETDDVLAE